MLPAPPIVMAVLSPILSPIAASTGDLVLVWPGHPTHTLTVTDASGQTVKRFRYMPDGALYGPLMILDADGVLACLAPEDRQRLQRSA